MTDLIERLRNYPMADAGGQMLTNEAADALEQNNEEIAERDAIIRILQSRLAKAEETKNIEQDAYDILAKQSEAEIARLREAIKPVLGAACTLDDPDPNWCQVRIDDLEALEEALEQTDD